MNVEILYFRDCPGREPALALLKQMLAEEGAPMRVVEIEVPGPEAVEEYRFVGSPTIRIDGVDLEGESAESRQGYGWRCRLYDESEPGLPKAVPAAELIRRRLRELGGVK